MHLLRLDPGELFIGTQPTEVHTVLGSCVALTLYHPNSKQGAICHGRKPTQGCQHVNHGLKVCREVGDYVDCSLEFMLGYFHQKGIASQELIIKLFGGGMMSANEGNNQCQTPVTMGKRNSDRAMELIQNKHLHLMASDCGGPWTRQLIFYSHTGEVKLKRIHTTLQTLDQLTRSFKI